jgi:splicing factor 3B subunit 1
LALGVAGLGREDACMHLMNYVWPNVFETSPHVIGAVTDAIEGMRHALGPTKILQYTLQVNTLSLSFLFLLLHF